MRIRQVGSAARTPGICRVCADEKTGRGGGWQEYVTVIANWSPQPRGQIRSATMNRLLYV
jgi:hypothetical protein